MVYVRGYPMIEDRVSSYRHDMIERGELKKICHLFEDELSETYEMIQDLRKQIEELK